MNQKGAKRSAKTSDLGIYRLYEAAVQSAEVHARWFDQIYGEINGVTPHLLREDFCGSFQISREWVKLRPNNFAMSLDLDPKVLAAGKIFAAESLPPRVVQRLMPLRKNVASRTTPKADIVVACNYSFFIFRERRDLLNYFRAVKGSLAKKGLFVLEMAGGPGMIEQVREDKILRDVPGFPGKTTYYWDQKSFDPVTQNGKYGIHFKLPGGRWIRDAFTYDWRLWTVPELKDALMDAGFKKVRIYWETEHQGVGTGEYLETESGDNAWSWIAYLTASC